VALTDSGTILALISMGLPFYSARDLKETRTLIKDIKANKQDLPRSIGGTLMNLVPPQFLKYEIKITSPGDIAPPAFDKVYAGTPVTVWSTLPLSYAVGGTPSRGVVSGSSVTSNGFVSYRPIHVCLVTDVTGEIEEWKGKMPWEIVFEEV
jgi:hypothetical protein